MMIKFEATDAKDFQDEIFDNSESNDNIEDRKQRADDKRFTVMDIKIRAIPADPKSKGLFISFSPPTKKIQSMMLIQTKQTSKKLRKMLSNEMSEIRKRVRFQKTEEKFKSSIQL
jgi:hypothetical protein